MTDIGVNLAAIFGGLLSGGFGFVIIGVILAMFIIPTVLIGRRDGKAPPDEPTSDPRY